MKDFRVITQVKNNRILEYMEREGIRNQSELARLSGVSATVVGEFINMKETAKSAVRGHWRSEVIRLAAALRAMPEDLFPEIQLYNKVEDNTVVQRIDADGFEMLASASRMAGLPPDRVVEIDSGKKALEGLLLSLTPKQERLIRKRFGLGAEREHTLEEIAEDFGVTRERIRQMEKKAFESLKFRASKLLEWRAVKDLHHTLMEIHNGQENTAR